MPKCRHISSARRATTIAGWAGCDGSSSACQRRGQKVERIVLARAARWYSANGAAGPHVRHELFITDHERAADEDVADTFGKLRRFFVGRAVNHACRVEHRDVGVCADFEASLIPHYRDEGLQPL